MNVKGKNVEVHIYIVPLEAWFLSVPYQWNASHYLPSRVTPPHLGVKITGNSHHAHAGWGT